MKKLSYLVVALVLFGFKPATPITQQERDYAIKLLQDTEQGVIDAVNNLSDAQLKFKPEADRWSVEECLKHIAISEKNLWAMTEQSIKQAANGDKKTGKKVVDDQLVKGAEDRSNKIKTFDALKPENTPYKSTTEALNDFKENREKLIAYVKTTNDNLRDHYSELPMGALDAYQLILLIGAHSNRHTQQIAEVKATAGFPE